MVRLVTLVLLVLSLPANAATATRSVSTDGTVIVTVTGRIEKGDALKLRSALGGTRNAVVLLQSPGGDATEGLRMGRLVRSGGHRTAVPAGTYCASACALIWLAGVTRSKHPQAGIGFHRGYRLADGRAFTSVELDRQVARYARTLGYGDAAVELIMRAQPADMLWLLPDEARAAGIGIDDWDPSTSAYASDRADIAELNVTAPIAPDDYVRQARLFLRRYLAAMSAADAASIAPLVELYFASTVRRNGSALSRASLTDALMVERRRWPVLRLKKGGAAEVSCEPRGQRCHVAVPIEQYAASLTEPMRGAVRSSLMLELQRRRGRYVIAAMATDARLPAPWPRSGSLARSVQEELTRHGCRPGAIDGIWGPRSQAALVRFDEALAGARPPLGPDHATLHVLQQVRAPICN